MSRENYLIIEPFHFFLLFCLRFFSVRDKNELLVFPSFVSLPSYLSTIHSIIQFRCYENQVNEMMPVHSFHFSHLIDFQLQISTWNRMRHIFHGSGKTSAIHLNFFALYFDRYEYMCSMETCSRTLCAPFIYHLKNFPRIFHRLIYASAPFSYGTPRNWRKNKLFFLFAGS